MNKVTGEQILFGILAYLGILVLIPLLVKKDDRWVQEHSRQGLALLILWVISWIVFMILLFIPIIGWIISVLLFIFLVIIWLIEIIKVISGTEPMIVPFFGNMAKSWKF